MRGLLLIDRGSKEEDVKEELDSLCVLIKRMSEYAIVKYSFLEVVSPYIEESILSCLPLTHLTIMPYFLYPGLKLKLAILKSKEIAERLGLNYSISDCLHYHPNLVKIVKNRINEVKLKNDIYLDDKECDLLLIGHGSTDIDARLAFESIYEEVRDHYRNTLYAFLELDEPTIRDGINTLLDDKPKVLIIMPYFLHKGTHIKYDINPTIESSIRGSDCKVYIAEHLGISKEMAEIVIDKAKGLI